MGIADVIEEYILRQLSSTEENVLVLRRNEIAEHIACAPSQISYVLHTRFTMQRGFCVESRRGSGGYIRIARAADRRMIFADLSAAVGEAIAEDEALRILHFLLQHGLVTPREAALLEKIVGPSCAEGDGKIRARILREVISLLGE